MAFARHPRTASRVIHDRAVVVNVDQNRLYTLSSTATRIWEALAQPRSANELAADLCAAYDVDEVTALADCLQFCSELQSRGLVVTSP
jgi:hypothetical protein